MFKKKHRGFQKELVRPSREWFVILAVGVCILIVGSAYGAYVFLKSGKNINGTSVVVETLRPPLDQKKMRRVLDMYEEKKRNFEVLKKTIPKALSVTATSSAASASIKKEDTGTTTKSLAVPPVAESGVLQVE